MGIFDRLFHRAPKESKFALALDGMMPIFGQYGSDIYASDVVQQALKCIVDEIKKLRPAHVRKINDDVVPVKSDLQKALMNPNPLMTTSELLEKITWLLLMNYNAFVLPTYYTWTDENTRGDTSKDFIR